VLGAGEEEEEGLLLSQHLLPLPAPPRVPKGAARTGAAQAQRPPPAEPSEEALALRLHRLRLQHEEERVELRSALAQLQAAHERTLGELGAMRTLHLETLAGAEGTPGASGASGGATPFPHPPRRNLLLLQSTNIQLKRALLSQQGQASRAAAQYQALLEEVLDVRKVVEAVTHNLQQPSPPLPSSSAKSKVPPRADGNVAALQSVCAVLARATRRASPRPSSFSTVQASSPSSAAEPGPPEDAANPAMLLLADFIAQPRGAECQPVHAAHLCSGSVAHLNLGQVGRLEGVLWSLTARLQALHATLDTAFLPHTLPGFRERTSTLLQGCQDGLQDACAALLSLSVLVPAAPLPALAQVRRLGGVDCSPDAGEEAQLLLARLPNLSVPTRSRLEGTVAGLVKLAHAARVGVYTCLCVLACV
jgi:hypothetical protein